MSAREACADCGGNCPVETGCPESFVNEAAVNIADVVAGAVRVEAHEVRVGDYLFDAFGGTHRVVDRRIYQGRKGSAGRVRLVRDDGWADTLDRHESITILRSERDE